MEKQANPTCKLLSSGNAIPRIGYGTYQLKGKECLEGVRWALQAGYTHIDTASIYKNEVEVGTVLKEMKIDRSKIYITSKIAPAEQGFNQAITACNQIIQRLDCGYLNLLIIHWPGVGKIDSKSEQNRIIRRETWKALVQLKQEGKVKDIGVSNYLKHHLEDLLQHSQVKPAINQFEIHPLLWEKDTIQFCQKHDIAIEAYSPLARSDQKLLGNPIIKKLSKKYNKTVAQICLKWALQHDFIVLPKSRSKQRIVENFNIRDFEINADDMKEIDSLSKANVRTCWDPNIITY